jgi:nitronate monooxygenase
MPDIQMTLTTPLTERLGISKPIIQGPMLGPSTPEMAAAATNAGGLGSLAASAMDVDAIRNAVADIRSRTDGPFNINLFVQDPPHPAPQELERAFALLNPIRQELGLPPAQPPAKYCADFRSQFDVLVELRVPVASFTFGLLDAGSVERLHRAGTLVIGTASNVAEARAWEANGADIICAQGAETGGHRGTFLGTYDDSMIGLMALVPQIVDSVRLPVVAAGGIMDGRGIAAALMLGAQAVQMGTAFLVTAESKIHPMWKARIREASDTSTRTTKTFTGRSARGIVNDFMLRLQDHEDTIPPYPVQNALTNEIRQAARTADRPEFLSMWAGQGAGLVRSRSHDINIRELMDQLMSELAQRFRHLEKGGEQ